MRIEKETIVAIRVNQEERMAISVVDVILRNIQDTFNSNCSFENMDTGEIFDVQELARVRGILGTIIDTGGDFRIR